MQVDVEILTADNQLLNRLIDSWQVMPQLLQRAGRVGGAECLPRIRADRPTEFENVELASLAADFSSLQEVARIGHQQEHLESLLHLLDEALGVQECRARFIPRTEVILTEDSMSSGLVEDDEIELGLLGSYEGECAGCDRHTSLDDIGLCEDCAAKLDRDMIRERDWERSVTAWACPQNRREELRSHVISRYGAKLELIAPSKPKKKPKSRKKLPRRAKK